MRRRSVVALLAGGALEVVHLAAEAPAEIRISAKKFEFHPNEITTRVGRPVTLILTSEDRIHGFKMPDLGLRADVIPGQETRLTLVPERLGRVAFLCDVFCGDGHDDMEGTLIVEA